MSGKRSGESGNALLGALATVVVTGVVSTGMVASYQSFVRQSRLNYIRAAQTGLDNKIRFMAMQPAAYFCGTQAGKGALDGLSTCVLNQTYFAPVRHVLLPGCKTTAGADCGFKLEWDPAQPDPSLKQAFKLGASGGELHYSLSYEGADFQLRPAGMISDDPDPFKRWGMPIPIEVLQSEDFDCAAENSGLTPVFKGFVGGRPRCEGFDSCGTGSFVSNVNFGINKVQCRSLRQNSKNVVCAAGQRKVSSVDWNNDVLNADCTDLPMPTLNGAYSNTTTTSGPPKPPEPPKPRTCADTVFSDTQAVSSRRQNGAVNMTVKFTDAVKAITPGCAMAGITINLRVMESYWGSCTNPIQFEMPDAGVPAQTGCIGCGGSGSKTWWSTAVWNGDEAYLTNNMGGWGAAAGTPKAACISDVVVTVHSKPN